MVFRGDFLLEVLKKCEAPLLDFHFLIHEAFLLIGKLIHDEITNKGYQSTYPKLIKDFEKTNLKTYLNEVEEADFHVELKFIEKGIFSSAEKELIEKFSESPLESIMGFELIKEAIPFIIQYEIKSDFPKQQSKRLISKPGFLIVDPFNPIAVFCDSYKFHQKKRSDFKGYKN